MKSDKKVTITIEVDNDLYFNMLSYCVAERITIDDFVEKALRNFIDVYGKKPAKKKQK